MQKLAKHAHLEILQKNISVLFDEQFKTGADLNLNTVSKLASVLFTNLRQFSCISDFEVFDIFIVQYSVLRLILLSVQWGLEPRPQFFPIYFLVTLSSFSYTADAPPAPLFDIAHCVFWWAVESFRHLV